MSKIKLSTTAKKLLAELSSRETIFFNGGILSDPAGFMDFLLSNFVTRRMIETQLLNDCNEIMKEQVEQKLQRAIALCRSSTTKTLKIED